MDVRTLTNLPCLHAESIVISINLVNLRVYIYGNEERTIDILLQCLTFCLEKGSYPPRIISFP